MEPFRSLNKQRPATVRLTEDEISGSPALVLRPGVGSVASFMLHSAIGDNSEDRSRI